MKKFFICAYNTCTRRAVDSQIIYEYLINNNYEFSKDYTEAHLIIIVTCGFIEETENISMKALKRLYKKRKPDSTFIISGCLPDINSQKLKIFKRSVIIPTANLNKFDEVINPSTQIKFFTNPDRGISIPEIKDVSESFIDRTKQYSKKIIRKIIREDKKEFLNPDCYNIKVLDGCINSCTYCGIKFVTKGMLSKPIDDIKNEFHNGLKKGYTLFRFVGEDIGSYGIDIDTNIVKLLNEIFKINDSYKLIVTNIHPLWLVHYFNDLLHIFKENKSRIEYFHFAIQSGSNNILSLMNRRYEIGEIINKLKILKNDCPEVPIITDIIIGFPGESENDFEETKKLIEKIHFSKLNIFKYSDRPNTEANKLPDKIPDNIIENRYKELNSIFNKNDE